MEQTVAGLDDRIDRLESRLSRTQFAWTATTLALGALLLASSGLCSPAEVIRVRGIVIEDGQGKPRILIGAPIPEIAERARKDAATGLVVIDAAGADRLQIGAVGGPQMGGKLNPRQSPAVGLMVNDPSGDERAGFGVFENGQCGWGLDYPSQREAIIAAVMPGSGFAGIMIAADKEESPARVMLVTTGEGETSLKLSDAKGAERATLAVDDKSPSLKILDEHGQVLNDLVTGKKAMTRNPTVLYNLICAITLMAVAPWQKPAAEPAKTAASPGPRRAFGLAFEETKQRMLLFGGASNPDVQIGLDTTWSLTGAKWSAMDVKGPSARRGCSMLFDAKRGRTVLFGGGQGDDPTSPVFDDTWLFDGATWTKSTASIPWKRSHFATAFDRKRECIVLVGGMNVENGKNLTDVLEWNGSEWKASAAIAPDALFAPQMAFDEKAGLLVLTSTKMPERNLMTWTFDGATFSKIDESGPAVILSGQSLATLGPRGGVVLFGGFGADKPLAETWTWDGKLWKKLDAPGPPPRIAQSMAFDRKRNCVVMYGGEDGTKVLDDLWEFDGRAWKEAKK